MITLSREEIKEMAKAEAVSRGLRMDDARKRAEANPNKTKFYVVNENIFGYINPIQPNDLGVLRGSILRGATHTWIDGPYPLVHGCDSSNIRPATMQDFDDFRISSKGYDMCPYHELPKN